MKQTSFNRRVLVLLFAFLFWQMAFSQPVREGLPQITDKYAIKGATVITSPGDTIEDALILIDDGLIKYVGKQKSYDGDAYTVHADSMYVYAGFINACSHEGLKKEEGGNERQRVPDPGNPTNEQAGIQPGRSILDMLDPEDKSIKDLRESGFAIGHVVPEGRMLPGMGSLVLYNSGGADGMMLKQDISMFARLRGARGVYPGTTIGVMAKFRELYRNAENAATHQKVFTNGFGVERPAYDRSVLALLPVIEKKVPVFFEAPDLKSVHRALALQKELGFDLVLTDVKQTWSAAQKIRDAGSQIVFSLDLPEDISEEKKKEDDEMEEEKPEKTWSETEKEKLEKRRSESLRKHLEEPARLGKSGMQLSFGTGNVKSRDILPNLRRLVENGMPEEGILAALTTNPAELFGISKYAGTVEQGKMANLVIFNQPFLQKDAQTRYVLVDGDLFAYEAKEIKKGARKGSDVAAGVAGSVVGTWSFSVETPGGSQTGSFDIEGDDGDLTGVIRSDGDDEETAISNVAFDEGQLSFEFPMDMEGNEVIIKIRVEIDGNSYSGDVSVGPMGVFPIEGSKRSPDQE